MSDTTSTTRSPHDIIGVATAFWTSKVVLSAVELGVFTRLSERSGSLEQLCADLSIRGRGARDFFDILVSLELLERDEGSYRNSELADAYLNPALPAYDISGYLRNLNAVFASRSLLTETLRSGGRLNYAKALAAAGADETAAGAVLMPADADADTFGEAFATPDQVRGFVRAMTGYSMGAIGRCCRLRLEPGGQRRRRRLFGGRVAGAHAPRPSLIWRGSDSTFPLR